MSQNEVIAAVEIGTRKTVVLVAEVIGNKSINILGRGECFSAGVKKGEIISYKRASEAAHTALSIAEKKTSRNIQSVYLACSGGHIDGAATKGSVPVSSSDNIITQEDIDTVAESAKARALPLDDVYINHIVSGYRVQNGDEVIHCKDPIGEVGEQLDVDYWNVFGKRDPVKNLINVINNFGLHVSQMIPSALGTGRMVTSDRERREGVLVVDIGSGCTDYVLYKNGFPQRVGVVPVGGDHLTNDLLLGLHLNFKNAENLKCRFGKAVIDRSDKDDNVFLIGDLRIGDRPISRLTIYKILQARIDELFRILTNRLGAYISPQNLPCGVILSGGSSQLPNLCEASKNIMGVPTRIGENPDWIRDDQLLSPEYSTVLGLLDFGLLDPKRGGHTKKNKNWGTKLKGIFSSN